VHAFRVRLPPDKEDLATAALFGLGTCGIEVQDGGEESVLLAYFEDRPGLLAALQEALHPWDALVEPAPVPSVDWVARFREGFQPFDAPPFRIVPAWEEPPTPGPDVIRIEPGQAFGTGTHETTRLCLQALGRLSRPLGSVLDLGTGTGILGIAAARLGSPSVTALDRDPDALDQARLHARLNAVELRLVCGDLTRPLRPVRFDVVTANLTAGLLVEGMEGILGHVGGGGRLILSGLLETDLPALLPTLGPLPRAILRDGEWAALVVER
jgi:ribosomal protein L11 methyltransferase